MKNIVTISIISHGQLEMIKLLLDDLEKYCKDEVIILLTLNLNEKIPESFMHYHLSIQYIYNAQPKGFGENHNAAFQNVTTPYFCVINPDIRLSCSPFPDLMAAVENNNNIGVAAPAVIDSNNIRQDNARHFPTIPNLIKRVLFKERKFEYDEHTAIIFPDWVAGMFMLFPSKLYREIAGFDQRFFLYCEDIDICGRLRQKNYNVILNNNVKVIHSAQRDSHKKLKYLLWHLRSMLRYLYRYYSNKYQPASNK